MDENPEALGSRSREKHQSQSQEEGKRSGLCRGLFGVRDGERESAACVRLRCRTPHCDVCVCLCVCDIAMESAQLEWEGLGRRKAAECVRSQWKFAILHSISHPEILIQPYLVPWALVGE